MYTDMLPDIRPGMCLLRFKKSSTLLLLTTANRGDVVGIQVCPAKLTKQPASIVDSHDNSQTKTVFAIEDVGVSLSPAQSSSSASAMSSLPVRQDANDFLENAFYEDDVREQPWDYQYYPDPEHIDWDNHWKMYFPVYFGQGTADKIRIIQEKILRQTDRLVTLLQQERDQRPGLLDGIRHSRELSSIGGLTLDRAIYFVDRQDFDDIYVATDFHGSEQAFRAVMDRTNFLERMKASHPRVLLVLLGDYVDRGDESLWVLYHAIKLKAEYPRNVILLRGNHEEYAVSDRGEPTSSVTPNDLFWRICKARVYDDSARLGETKANCDVALASDTAKAIDTAPILYSPVFRKRLFGELFGSLPTGALISGKATLFLSHGGVPYPMTDPPFDTLMTADFDYNLMVRADPESADRYKAIRFLGDLTQQRFQYALVWSGAGTAKGASSASWIGERYKKMAGGDSRKDCLYNYQNIAGKFGFDAILLGHDHPESGMDTIELGDKKRIIVLCSAGAFPDAGDQLRNEHRKACLLWLTDDSTKIQTIDLHSKIKQ